MQSFYFDYNATTPIAAAVLEVYSEALRNGFGNASSIHFMGQAAKQALESARKQVARRIGCDPKELVFNSGGTESDNHAISGATRGVDRPHIITSSIEHPAVLNTVSRAVDVTIVPVSSDGLVDPDDVRRAIRPESRLISIMHVNNEIGSIQPIAEIARIAREHGVCMHSDGVQAAGRIDVDVKALGVDLYSISAHKMQGPKGVGALYVRKGYDLPPVFYGGRHEAGRRAGTENTPAIVAMGAAAELAAPDIAGLRDQLEQGILERVPQTRVNAASRHRAPNTTNICFEGIEGESMVIALDLRGFCVSSGSACSSGAVEPSHVLLALGMSKEQAKSSVRFSLGAGNTLEQVDRLIDAVEKSASHLRRLSPTYEAHV